MFNIELKEVHVGHAIKARLEKLNMTKTEFGRQIGVPQQHINRILERETMETAKLVKICKVLDYNFFALFCSFPTSINAYLAAVALGDGDAQNYIGDAAMLAELELTKEKNNGLEESKKLLQDQVDTLKGQVSQLQSQLTDKDELIKLYKTNREHNI